MKSTASVGSGGKAVGRKLGFAVVVLLGVFASAEATLRLFGSPKATDAQGTVMVPDQSKIWALAPGENDSFGATSTIGLDGLRVPLRSGGQAAPVVLTLGDSSVFGHGVGDGDTLHDQLQTRLLARGVDAAVKCGGVPGYSTEQSIQLLEETGWALDPVALVVANQFSDMNRDQFPDRVVLETLNSPVVLLSTRLSDSAVYRSLQGLVARAKGVPEYAAVGWPSPSSAGVPRVPPVEYVANLEHILAEARERSVAVVFLQLPERQALLNGDRPTYAVLMDFVAAAWGVPIVYGDEAFRSSGLAPSALFQDEVHPTAAGHGVLAAALTAVLIAEGFPKQMSLPLAQPIAEIPEFKGELPPTHLGSMQEAILRQR